MISVYATELASNKEFKYYETDWLSSVSPSRSARALRYRFDEDRQRCLLGELLVRHALARYFNVQTGKEDWVEDDLGKPVLRNRRDVHFNLSHSGRWVVCAISRQPVGVDVEYIRPSVDLNLSRRYFSCKEQEALMEASERGAEIACFFDIWTLKESYLKAKGLGLRVELNQFSVYEGSEGIILFDSAEDREEGEICFRRYHLDSDHALAVCGHEKEFQTGITLVDRELV